MKKKPRIVVRGEFFLVCKGCSVIVPEDMNNTFNETYEMGFSLSSFSRGKDYSKSWFIRGGQKASDI